jgi:hypothetical protein
MRKFLSFLFVLSFSNVSFAEDKKELNIKSSHSSNETITINHNVNMRTDQKTETQSFCSKAKEEAKARVECVKACKAWLADQKKSLGKKLLTFSCDSGRSLYGQEDKESGCMSYICSGKVTYGLK